MAKHEVLVTSAGLREYMERRFSYLYRTDGYNGQDAGEYSVLESIVCDLIEEGVSSSMDVGQLEGNFATLAAVKEGDGSGGGHGGSRACLGSPRLLTGGAPCTESSEPPLLPGVEVPSYSHGGYDGGVVVGFEGTWNPFQFSRLISILEEAKELAGTVMQEEGIEGLPLDLDGVEVLVSPKGGLAGGDHAKGGVVYKYRFFCQGVEFLIHSNPSKHIQPVRVRYGAESVQGHRNRFFDVHFGFVLPLLKRLGLTVQEDKLSRVDMQCLIDVPMSEIEPLLRRNSSYMVTKLRKLHHFGTTTRIETIELGSVGNVQFCFYDKSRELRAKKSNIVKEALFIRDCVGDEWYNSGRPVTRIEIRLGRDALKALDVDSVSDLQKSERAIVDLLTTEWLRILESPKVRGHENSAAIHPIWERVRNLFFQYFTGSEVDVHWNRKESVVCDPVALELQALGCLSKALAYSFGEQESEELSLDLGRGWVERVWIG
jgi:hypothetical protein